MTKLLNLSIKTSKFLSYGNVLKLQPFFSQGPYKCIKLSTYLYSHFSFEGDRGVGARENRRPEGYGIREKKGREAGSLRWR